MNDAVAANAMTDDIDNQGPFEDAPDLINLDNNYSYDPTGNLIRDKQEKIDKIEWTVSGKVSKIIREANSTLADLEFRYDALGNRVMKIVKPDGTSAENGGTDDPTEWTVTHYVRDANGNPMAVYEEKYPSQQLELTLKERYLYGSSRLGMNTDTVDMMVTHNPNFRQRHLGKKMYELNNHLGNVLAVVTDKKIPIQNGTTGMKSHYVADVVSVSDYYPFGAVMGERTWSGEQYRYGFNGKEGDDEVKGSGNSYNFGARILDPRLGSWLSIDPKFKLYPSNGSYVVLGNSPMYFIDPGGETLRVAGHVEQAMIDLRSMVPEGYRSAIQVSKSGEIFIDVSKLSNGNSNPGTGYSLINDLINSNNNYEYRVANDNNGASLSSANGTIENNSKTPRMDFNKNGDNLPLGIDGQVIIAKDAEFTATSDRKENRASVVFHELQENYERTDNELPYLYRDPKNPSKENLNRKGSHRIAIDKAEGLAPEAKSVSGNEGVLKSAKLLK